MPAHLRARIVADAERCQRSVDAQVVAILRRHYGEDVDIAPAPEAIVALARGSLNELSDTEIRRVTRRAGVRTLTSPPSRRSTAKQGARRG